MPARAATRTPAHAAGQAWPGRGTRTPTPTWGCASGWPWPPPDGRPGLARLARGFGGSRSARRARLRRLLLLSLGLAGGAGRAARVPRRRDRLLLDVALGHEADEHAVGPVVPGHTGDDGYQVAPWCGVAFGAGRRLAP